MQFILLFLLAVTGPTELDSNLDKYRTLVAQATLATEETSQLPEIRDLTKRLTGYIRVISDPVFQDTYFLIAYKGDKEGVWRHVHSSSARYETQKFVPGKNKWPKDDRIFTFNVQVIERMSHSDYIYFDGHLPTPLSEFTLPMIQLEMGKKYFLEGFGDVVIMNRWLFSTEQLAPGPHQYPLKPMFFSGDLCRAREGYYTPLKNFNGMLLVELQPWPHSDTNCPPGTVFEVKESDFLEEIYSTRGEGNIFIKTLPDEAEIIFQRLSQAMIVHRNEVAAAMMKQKAEAEEHRRHQEMKDFIDTQMAKSATQP